jgi:hypothetical protein
MEGSENFDFFRQPDFVPDDFLKGSYAVYKKETLLGEGTGKLCHIHRPEIIDARGRRCWGELSIIGNELRITIPEQWLSEAAYPVIVDPIFGTNTVGSQFMWDHDPPEPWVPLFFEGEIPVNRLWISQALNGRQCKAYFYTNNDEYKAGGYPVAFSYGVDSPNLRRSKDESYIDFSVNSNKPKGWRSGTFTVEETANPGFYLWFGCYADYSWLPRFDYGGIFHNVYFGVGKALPNVYPGYTGTNRPMNTNGFKLSMYFEVINSQNYVRTLTQGVRLTDKQNITGDYKRSAIQTVEVNTATNSFLSIFRKLYEAVHGKSNDSFSVLFNRSILETIKVTETFYHLGEFFRGLFDAADIKSESEAKRGSLLTVRLIETVKVTGFVFRGLILFVRIVTGVFVRDYLLGRYLKARQEIVLKSPISREIILESKIG